MTATLDGKVLNEATSFSLTIGDHPDLADDPNTDIDGDGDMDDADATKDNREAQRDLDYTATLATLTIPEKFGIGDGDDYHHPPKSVAWHDLGGVS